eukprot:scaffold4092_cov271-Prasinococcus_capsulatus_cf.AAC.2
MLTCTRRPIHLRSARPASRPRLAGVRRTRGSACQRSTVVIARTDRGARAGRGRDGGGGRSMWVGWTGRPPAPLPLPRCLPACLPSFHPCSRTLLVALLRLLAPHPCLLARPRRNLATARLPLCTRTRARSLDTAAPRLPRARARHGLNRGERPGGLRRGCAAAGPGSACCTACRLAAPLAQLSCVYALSPESRSGSAPTSRLDTALPCQPAFGPCSSTNLVALPAMSSSSRPSQPHIYGWPPSVTVPIRSQAPGTRASRGRAGRLRTGGRYRPRSTTVQMITAAAAPS